MTTMQRTTDLALAHDVRISVMRLARRLRSERGDHPLSLTQIAALATIERHGPITPGELAAQERVQPPSMTRVIAALEQLGLIVRTAHPSDRRQFLVAISPAGSALLRGDRRRRDAWLAQRLRDLSGEERALLHAAAPILERLARA